MKATGFFGSAAVVVGGQPSNRAGDGKVEEDYCSLLKWT